MAYRLPNFNLLANAWGCGVSPASDPPTWTDVRVQKYLQSRPPNDVTPPYQANYTVEWNPPIVIRGDRTMAPFDSTPYNYGVWAFECPAGSGQYYRVSFEEIMHQGFPNEYDMFIVTQCTSSGTAAWIPGSSNPTADPGDPCA